jgi:hypothetical protein
VSNFNDLGEDCKHDRSAHMQSMDTNTYAAIKTCRSSFSGFGGLEVACWPLLPKFAGSNPAEAVGFFRAKKSSAHLPSEGK